MGHKNPDRFFNDPSAINPQTGQLLQPQPPQPQPPQPQPPQPPPPPPPPDSKLLAVQAKAQSDQAIALHQSQAQQQKAKNDAIHLQVKTQSEIALAKIKVDLDAKMAVLDAHLKAATEARKTPRSYPPGARKARDGHHHVADSQRSGKYLLVIHHA